MKYIRTKDGIYEFVDFTKTEGMRCANHYGYRDKKGVGCLGELKDWKEYKKADTIEELCDEFVLIENTRILSKPVVMNIHKNGISDYFKNLKATIKYIYGAIWTDKGLIYVSKMNNKGEMELL